MKRSYEQPFSILAAEKGASSHSPQHEPRRNRPPPDVREGIHVQMKAAADNSNIHRGSTSKTVPAQACAVKAPINKWRSPFIPLGDSEEGDDNSQEQSTTSSERVELYDPFDTVLSDSDDNLSPLGNKDIQETQHLSPGLDQTTSVTRYESKRIIMDKEPISCDLCDVEFTNGQELEDHLQTKSHWDTLEHIQQHNNYDDITIAFLQDVMLYKGHNCSHAIEESALQALQENDHMTRVEMFHCAACNVLVSTSVSSVQGHITSPEHLSNTKEFEVKQRHVCLDKAKNMMEKMKPHFEDFKQGVSLFDCNRRCGGATRLY